MSDSKEQQLTPKRGRKACTECRQQKARCDAFLKEDEPCSRCKRMNIPCVISEPFKREHKRKRLSELEKETEILKRQLGASRLSAELTSPNASSSSFSQTPQAPSQAPPPFHLATQKCISTDFQTSILPQPSTHGPIPDSQMTIDQSLGDVKVSGKTIDELFRLYFDHHHRFLKILDPTIPPNSYYAESPLLFWTVVGTASRAYTPDPNLLYVLAPNIIDMVLTSLRKQSPLNTVKALLLLLTWPFPRGVLDAEIAYPISGAMLHVAMQIGLHIPASSQDFSRVKLKLTEDDINERCDIWARVIIAYHRCCSYVGQHTMTVLDKSHDPEQVFHLTERLPPSLKFQLMLHRIEARCCDALLENGLRKLPPERETTLDILLRIFEAQLNDIEEQAPTELTKICHSISRLTIQLFHFYKAPNEKEAVSFTRVYTSSCRVIELINGLGIDKQTLAYAPRLITHGIVLATTSLLRLLKSWFARYLNYEQAKSTLFLGVDLARHLSISNKDAYTKLITVLTQLWGSERAFKRPDGSEFTALRIRSRLSMSPVADTLWWWREEFGGQAGAYPFTNEDEKPTPSKTSLVPGHVDPSMADNPSTLDWMEPFYFLDDQLLAEFGFNLDNTENGGAVDASYGEWPTNTGVNGFNINPTV